MKNNSHENKSMNPSKENKEQDQRGGNHNPEGANQYTTGRVDDRGRKEDPNQPKQNETPNEALERLEDENENNPE